MFHLPLSVTRLARHLHDVQQVAKTSNRNKGTPRTSSQIACTVEFIVGSETRLSSTFCLVVPSHSTPAPENSKTTEWLTCSPVSQVSVLPWEGCSFFAIDFYNDVVTVLRYSGLQVAGRASLSI
jgi:hypothetical protein